MKKQVEAWIKFAEKDMLTVSEIIENPNLTNIVAFHCQQAIEKYFKAFIIENGKSPARNHNLLALYGVIKEITDLNINEDLLSTVNDIYLESRYPGEIGLLDYWMMVQCPPLSKPVNSLFLLKKLRQK